MEKSLKLVRVDINVIGKKQFYFPILPYNSMGIGIGMNSEKMVSIGIRIVSNEESWYRPSLPECTPCRPLMLCFSFVIYRPQALRFTAAASFTEKSHS